MGLGLLAGEDWHRTRRSLAGRGIGRSNPDRVRVMVKVTVKVKDRHHCLEHQ